MLLLFHPTMRPPLAVLGVRNHASRLNVCGGQLGGLGAQERAGGAAELRGGAVTGDRAGLVERDAPGGHGGHRRRAPADEIGWRPSCPAVSFRRHSESASLASTDDRYADAVPAVGTVNAVHAEFAKLRAVGDLHAVLVGGAGQHVRAGVGPGHHRPVPERRRDAARVPQRAVAGGAAGTAVDPVLERRVVAVAVRLEPDRHGAGGERPDLDRVRGVEQLRTLRVRAARPRRWKRTRPCCPTLLTVVNSPPYTT